MELVLTKEAAFIDLGLGVEMTGNVALQLRQALQGILVNFEHVLQRHVLCGRVKITHIGE